MTRTLLRLAFSFALLAVTRPDIAQEMHPAAKSNAPFDQLKSLTGTWEGQQPTMQSAPLVQATDNYNFQFVSVAGTKTPEEGHLAALSLTIPDKDHLKQVRTFEDHGQRSSETFLYIRKQ